MIAFHDAFTGVIYEMGNRWLKAVRKEVADSIAPRLQEGTEAAADAVASFWRDDYYERLFPLRFGRSTDEGGLYTHVDLFSGAGRVDLEAMADQPQRKRFLDGDKLPPILPAINEGETHELLADRVLTQAALVNVLLRQAGATPEVLHQARLACLTYPLLEYLQEPLRAQPDEVMTLAHFLQGESEELPSKVAHAVMEAVRDLQGFGDRSVWLVLVAAQRIKRYVFETPGLNEIRGASTLLDDLTEKTKEVVSKALGPEVVLRAVGSTLLFLAPTKEEANRWVEGLRRAFYEATGTAFVAATQVKVPVHDLVASYQQAVGEAFAALEQDRAKARQPLYEALPFEARCQICRIRPAEGWITMPGETEGVPACRVCWTKRRAGLPERAEKARQMLNWLGLSNPRSLGVKGEEPKEYVAQSLGMEDEEQGFIPSGARRPLIATIYGDGNNFGAVGQELNSIAMGLQWTQRVEKTTRAAAALALARATQETARDRGWEPGQHPVLPRLPFQVLALGGDDLSLFAWAPVGLRFARDFVSLINREFQRGEAQPIVEQPIAFSLGMLLTDHKAAVRRTVEVAEEDLLKWAKQAFRESELTEGNVALLLAISQEQIPDDLDAYRKRTYLNRGKMLDLCLTLRPFTAEELTWLLGEAEILREQSGSLHRMVAPFVQSSPLVAMLHYVYQRGRFDKQLDHWLKALETSERPPSLQGLRYPAAPRSRLDDRCPFGLKPEQDGWLVWFTPLWDLLELVKVLE